MPSYTSSSRFVTDRMPKGVGLKTLCLMLFLFLTVLAAIECFWRSQGHKSNMSDTVLMWAAEREKINDDKGMVVLIGASRIQLGFDTNYFRQEYQDRPLVNLAIDGTPPMAVLRDLAENSNFRGTIILSAKSEWFTNDNWNRAQGHVKRYHTDYRYSFDRRIDTQIDKWMQGNLVSLQQNLNLKNTVQQLMVHQSLPKPFYIQTLPDRSKKADYQLMDDIEGHRQKRVEKLRNVEKKVPVASLGQWKMDVESVMQWAYMIQDRGGRIIFVRFPTSGEHWNIDERRYPKARYWNQFARMKDVEAYHFRDIKGMNRDEFDLPDTSHLDQKDRRAFTKILLDELML